MKIKCSTVKILKYQTFTFERIKKFKAREKGGSALRILNRFDLKYNLTYLIRQPLEI